METQYLPVSSREFAMHDLLEVDLYLKLNSKKYIKIGRRGHSLREEQIEDYLKKGVVWLYLNQVDFTYYVDFRIGMSAKTQIVDSIQYRNMISLFHNAAERHILKLGQEKLKLQNLQQVLNVTLNTVKILSKHPQTFKLLQYMKCSRTFPEHALAVSIWSCLIAQQMGWCGEPRLFLLSLCALLHEVGQQQHTSVKSNDNEKGVKILESHTLRGYDILRSVPGMPEEAALVALQHHESASGNGYPHSLTLEQIHPFSRIVGLANRFCELHMADERSPQPISSCLAALFENQESFDLTYLKKLEEVLRDL